MSTILDQIVAVKLHEIEQLKSDFSYKKYEGSPLFHRSTFSLKKSIRSTSFGVIAEIKRKSPSAGTLAQWEDIETISAQYDEAEVSGISCLTDFEHFGMTVADLIKLRSLTDLPLLRKEFILDPIQIFEAKACGADAILLIAKILSKKEIQSLTELAQSMGMEVLLEVHIGDELDKISGQEDMIGVNNRNLALQKTDINTSFKLFDQLPKEKTKISESGIQSSEQIKLLKEVGYHGALIGESFLKANEPKILMNQFRNAL